MTSKEVEKFVGKYSFFKAKLEVLTRQEELVKEVGVSALKYKLVPTSSNTVARPTESKALKESIGHIKKQKTLIKSKIAIIDDALGGLDKLERRVIEFKLKKKMTYAQVAEKLCISEIYAKKLKKAGLSKLTKLLTL